MVAKLGQFTKLGPFSTFQLLKFSKICYNFLSKIIFFWISLAIPCHSPRRTDAQTHTIAPYRTQSHPIAPNRTLSHPTTPRKGTRFGCEIRQLRFRYVSETCSRTFARMCANALPTRIGNAFAEFRLHIGFRPSGGPGDRRVR